MTRARSRLLSNKRSVSSNLLASSVVSPTPRSPGPNRRLSFVSLQSPKSTASCPVKETGNRPRHPSCDSKGNTTLRSQSGGIYEYKNFGKYPGKWYQVSEFLFWTVSRGDSDLLKSQIQLFPMKFYDPLLEAQFEISLRETYRSRCLLMSICGVVGFVVYIVIFSILFNIELLREVRSITLPATITAMAVSATFFGVVGLIPFVRAFETRPERSATWVALCGSNSVQAWASSQATHITACLAMRLWVDICITTTWLHGIIALDIVLRPRTRYTWICHVILFISIAIPYLILYAVDVPEEVFFVPEVEIMFINVLSWLQIVSALLVIQLALSAKMYKELQERSEFLRTQNAIKLIMRLLNGKKTPRTGAATVVEEMINVVEKAQNMVKAIAIGTGNANLIACGEVLLNCVDSLQNTDELFSIRFQTNEDGNSTADHMQEQYYILYANKQTRQNPSRGGALVAAGGQVRKVSSVDNMTGKGSTTIRNQSSFPKAGQFWASHRQTFDKLQTSIGTEWSVDFLKHAEATSFLFVNVGTALLGVELYQINSSEDVMLRLLTAVQKFYQPNPYHNSTHAAMVAHSTVFFAKHLQLFESPLLQGWEYTAIALAALCHDIGHPGRNNNFFISAQLKVAQLYNDIAVLEQFHCFLTFSILLRKDHNIFSVSPFEDFRSIRKRIIELILATDMTQHFESVSRFRLRIRSPDFDILGNMEDWWTVARMCIKAGDLGHAMVQWSHHVAWSLRVTEEFYQQGDDEIKRGIPVSALCDRSTHNQFAKSQKGFLEFVVQPLIKELENIDKTDIIGSECMRALLYNKFKWEEFANDGREIIMPPDIEKLQTVKNPPIALLRSEFEVLIKNIDIQKLLRQENRSGSGSHLTVPKEITTLVAPIKVPLKGN